MPNRMTDSFEGNLAALRPAAGVGQASFYYRAGQVSKERAVRTWRLLAGSAIALLLVALGICAWSLRDAEIRIAEAEAKRIPTATIAVSPEPLPIPISPSADEDLRPYAAPMSLAEPVDDMTPGEVASTLELRRNILTAGLSYLDAQPKRGVSKARYDSARIP